MKNKILSTILVAGLYFLTPLCVYAQQIRDTSSFHQPIMIDEVVINAFQDGINVEDFIEIIKGDTTFYKAFKSLHLQTYYAENDIKVYDKRGEKIIASLVSETKQIYRDDCRTMNVLEEEVTGNFYKRNGDYRYFTAELYAELFFTEGKVCNENNIVKGSLEEESRGKGRIEKSKIQLKHLIFNPGHRISGIPPIGNKVAIFEPEIAKMYDFQIITEEKNGVACYLFEAKPKPEYERKVVINLFRTWLRQSDFSMISRDYALSYKFGVYDFDVKMHVDLKMVNNQLLPSYITYDGNWFLITKGRERVKFFAKFDY